MSHDEDAALDRWSFFTLISEEPEDLRKRIDRRLQTMTLKERAEWMEGGRVAMLRYHLQGAHTAARWRPRTAEINRPAASD